MGKKIASSARRETATPYCIGDRHGLSRGVVYFLAGRLCVHNQRLRWGQWGQWGRWGRWRGNKTKPATDNLGTYPNANQVLRSEKLYLFQVEQEIYKLQMPELRFRMIVARSKEMDNSWLNPKNRMPTRLGHKFSPLIYADPCGIVNPDGQVSSGRPASKQATDLPRILCSIIAEYAIQLKSRPFSLWPCGLNIGFNRRFSFKYGGYRSAGRWCMCSMQTVRLKY